MVNCGNGWEFVGKNGRKNFRRIAYFPNFNPELLLLKNLTIIMIKYETFPIFLRIIRKRPKNMKFSQTFAHEMMYSESLKKEIFGMHMKNVYEQNAVSYSEKDMSSEEKKQYFSLAEHLIRNETNEVFIFRKTALEIAKKINVKYEKRFDYLKKMKDGYKYFVTGENTFYKFFKLNNIISCIDLEIKKLETGERIGYCMYTYDLDSNYEFAEGEESTQESKELFLKLLIFYEFAKHETIYVEPGRKHGTRNEGKVLNDSTTKVTIIDSTWNKIIIRKEGFDVQGHLRLQACGKNLEQRELIWVDDYKKNGYVRGLKNKSEVL